MASIFSSFESTELAAWKQLCTELFSSIHEFLQSPVSSHQLDVCLDKLDTFLSSNCKPHYPNLLCTALEQLPQFDQVFIQAQQIHPKLLSISYKNTLKLVSSTAPPKQLNGAMILQSCAMRTLQRNTNRSKEEEAKIESFMCTQLNRLLAAQLPNRSSAFPTVVLALVSLKSNCKPSVCNAIEVLSRDAELDSQLQEVCNVLARGDEDLLELLLTQLLPRMGSSKLTEYVNNLNIDVLAKVIAKTRGEITLHQVLQQENVLEFLLLARACEYKQQGESWSRVALQGMEYRASSCIEVNQTELGLKIDMFCRFAWRIHPQHMLDHVMSLGPITMENCARLLLLKLCPEQCITMQAKQFVLSCSNVQQSAISERWQLELFAVKGKFGFYSEEALRFALQHFNNSNSTLCLEVLIYNSAAFTDSALLVAALELITPSGTALLHALANRSLLFASKDVDLRVPKLAMELVTRALETTSNETIKQEVFSHLAEVLAFVEDPHLFIQHFTQFKPQFLDYMRRNQHSTAPAAAATSTMFFPKLPSSAPPQQQQVKREGAHFADCVDRVKRMCSTLSISELSEFESQLFTALQQAKLRKT